MSYKWWENVPNLSLLPFFPQTDILQPPAMKVFLVLLALIVATSGRAVESESEEESNVLDLTDETYKSTIKNTKGRVFVRFYSSLWVYQKDPTWKTCDAFNLLTQMFFLQQVVRFVELSHQNGMASLISWRAKWLSLTWTAWATTLSARSSRSDITQPSSCLRMESQELKWTRLLAPKSCSSSPLSSTKMTNLTRTLSLWRTAQRKWKRNPRSDRRDQHRRRLALKKFLGATSRQQQQGRSLWFHSAYLGVSRARKLCQQCRSWDVNSEEKTSSLLALTATTNSIRISALVSSSTAFRWWICIAMAISEWRTTADQRSKNSKTWSQVIVATQRSRATGKLAMKSGSTSIISIINDCDLNVQWHHEKQKSVDNKNVSSYTFCFHFRFFYRAISKKFSKSEKQTMKFFVFLIAVGGFFSANAHKTHDDHAIVLTYKNINKEILAQSTFVAFIKDRWVTKRWLDFTWSNIWSSRLSDDKATTTQFTEFFDILGNSQSSTSSGINWRTATTTTNRKTSNLRRSIASNTQKSADKSMSQTQF